MLKLYAFATPNNLKPLIMMEELGLEYELLPVNIRQGDQKADAFLKLNPNAKVPVLVDPEGRSKEFVLTESAAILVVRSVSAPVANAIAAYSITF